MNSVAICLWLDGRAEEAADFYLDAFATALGEGTAVRLGTRPLAGDRVPAISLGLAGQQFRLLQGAPAAGHNGAAAVALDSRARRDALAEALADGADILPNGWMIDRFGTAWLVTSPHTSARHTVIDSPLGPLTLVVDRELLIGLWFEDHRGRPAPEDLGARIDVADDPVLATTSVQLDEYFAGTRTEFDLPLEMTGGTFETHVWKAVQSVRLGDTATYRDIAVRLHDPRAAQAAGGAIGRNPISIVVPCHRIVASDGDLTGYAGGLLRKQWMLDHEAYVAGHILFDAPAEGHLAYTDPEVASEVRSGLGEGFNDGPGAESSATPRRRAGADPRLPEDVPLLPDPADNDDSDTSPDTDEAALAGAAGEAPDIAMADLRLPRHGAFASDSEVLLDSFPAGTPVRLDATLQLRGAGTAEILVRRQQRDRNGAPIGDGTEHALRMTAPQSGDAALVLDRGTTSDGTAALDDGTSSDGAAASGTGSAPASSSAPVRRAGASAVADLVLTIGDRRLEVAVDGAHTLVRRTTPGTGALEVALRAQGSPARLGHPD